MRDRVMAVIEKSGFRPNANARRLVRGSSGQVCFLLSNRDLSDSFHSRILKGVEDYSRQQHHHVVYTGFDYGADTALPNPDLPRILGEDGGTEGVVLAGTDSVLVRYIESLSIHTFCSATTWCANPTPTPSKIPSGSTKAKAHARPPSSCWSSGIARWLSLATSRRSGTGADARDIRQPWKPKTSDPCWWICRGSPTRSLGCRAVPELIRRCSSATAVLAQDDETACGLVVTLRRIGIAVPADLSVIGFDDIRSAQYLTPPLTTVRVPKERVGWTMAEQLFQRIHGKRSPAVLLGTELVIRESCARAPAGPRSLVAKGSN